MDKLHKLAHDRFASLIYRAKNAQTEEERRRYLHEADTIARQVFATSSLKDFAYVVGADVAA